MQSDLHPGLLLMPRMLASVLILRRMVKMVRMEWATTQVVVGEVGGWRAAAPTPPLFPLIQPIRTLLIHESSRSRPTPAAE